MGAAETLQQKMSLIY